MSTKKDPPSHVQDLVQLPLSTKILYIYSVDLHSMGGLKKSTNTPSKRNTGVNLRLKVHAHLLEKTTEQSFTIINSTFTVVTMVSAGLRISIP